MPLGLNISLKYSAALSSTLVFPLPFLPVRIKCFRFALSNGIWIFFKCRTLSTVKSVINSPSIAFLLKTPFPDYISSSQLSQYRIPKQLSMQAEKTIHIFASELYHSAATETSGSFPDSGIRSFHRQAIAADVRTAAPEKNQIFHIPAIKSTCFSNKFC